MRLLGKWTMVIMAVTILSSALPAQSQEEGRGDRSRRGGFGGPGFGGPQGDALGLLRNPDVQKELKVSDEEESYIGILADEVRDQDREFFESLRDADREERGEKMREHFSSRQKEVNEKLGEILGEDRMKRLKEIRLQVGGPMALFSPDVAAELKITDEQRDQFREAVGNAFMELRRQGDDDSKSREKRFEEFRKSQSEKLMSILTPEQRSQWEKMKGEPINFKLPPPNFGRGDRDRDRLERRGPSRRSRDEDRPDA